MDTEEAVERGTKFLQDKAGYYTHKLVSVKLEENVWVVRFDVGAFEEKIVELKAPTSNLTTQTFSSSLTLTNLWV